VPIERLRFAEIIVIGRFDRGRCLPVFLYFGGFASDEPSRFAWPCYPANKSCELAPRSQTFDQIMGVVTLDPGVNSSLKFRCSGKKNACLLGFNATL
jgi:hypothetical protein